VQEPLDLPPGPNNPVGLVWIALSAKGYGIHGTPDPAAVSKRTSHGCVRLTNWNVTKLIFCTGVVFAPGQPALCQPGGFLLAREPPFGRQVIDYAR
jgi:hypothetical protein